MNRRCTKCGRDFPATSEFFNQNGRWLRSQCKECTRAYASAYGKEHRDSIRAKRQERHEADPQSRKQRARSYYEAHREELIAGDAAYKKAHPEVGRRASATYRERHPDRVEAYKRDRAEQIAEYHRRWRDENRERVRDYRRTRRARERAGGECFTADDIRTQHGRQRGLCYWCGLPVTDGYHVDHVVPLARGGSNAPENIVIACPSCNRRKHAKLPHEFGDRLC